MARNPRRRTPRPIAGHMQMMMRKAFGDQRLTLDNPIRPDVWLKFATAPDAPIDVIITPTEGIPPGPTAAFIRQRVSSAARVAYGRNSIAALLGFDVLITLVVPLTHWWQTVVLRLAHAFADATARQQGLGAAALSRAPGGQPPDEYRLRQSYDWLVAIANRTDAADIANIAALASAYNLWDLFRFAALLRVADARNAPTADFDRLVEQLTASTPSSPQIREVIVAFGRYVDAIDQTMDAMRSARSSTAPALWGAIWSVTGNRPATTALNASQRTIKADAACSLFSIRTDDITWAVVDCGIDARHPAFQDLAVPDRSKADPLATTRVRSTYDFTLLRDLLSTGTLPVEINGKPTPAWVAHNANAEDNAQRLADLRVRLDRGDDIDWSIVAPLIEMPHAQQLYQPPAIEHGTHVAGILGGCWSKQDNPEGIALIGIAPEIRLLDIRVFTEDGGSDEDTIVHALEFVMYLNRRRDLPAVHGVNLSLSLVHEVKSFACGQTPICIECNRIADNGIVVVAAAGNRGVEAGTGTGSVFEAFRDVSITDPGNAEAVITVGATHRSAPHTFGVSYFSSRGPTGDGRRKPDLLAPGEKIVAPVPEGGSKALDGTSMAAPHVSGAAALLMARHRELIGQSRRIKQLLCASATDLGREAHFQGAGLVDVLRALQSV
jgi:serine protease AprX